MNTSGHGTGLFFGSKKHLLLALAGSLCLAGGMLLRAEPASVPAPGGQVSPAAPVRGYAPTRGQCLGLLNAAETGNLADVQQLLDLGVPVDYPNMTNGQSPLMFAAKGGHAKVAHLLMEKGADVSLPSATEAGRLPLSFATEGGSLELMEDLLQHGAKVDGKGRNGMTALGYAAFYGLLPQAKFLVSKGADINLPGKKNQYDESFTPLMLAVCNDQAEMVSWLLDQGADLEKATTGGTTALGASGKRDAPAATKILIQRGAKLEVRGLGGHTPLMCACNNGYPETVKLLLEAGANPFLTCEEEGKDALGHANYSGNEEVIEAVKAAQKRWKETKERL